MISGGDVSSDTPVMKKRKMSGSPLLVTPTRVLEQVKNVSSKNKLYLITNKLPLTPRFFDVRLLLLPLLLCVSTAVHGVLVKFLYRKYSAREVGATAPLRIPFYFSRFCCQSPSFATSGVGTGT